ncbi:MAG: hypothetical protein Q8R60_01700 [Mycobacteriales bacterium]|nr:hypothetical protein [Mycobacteriales bacterium]
MTTTTVDTQSTLTSPVGAARSRFAGTTRSAWSTFTAERRATRAFRAQERAFGNLCGTERSDVLAVARRSA